MVTQLASDPRSVAAARRFVAAALEQWDRRDQIEDATLLTSEVVTNAVVHARTDVDLRVIVIGALVRVEVADGSRNLPEITEEPVTTGGRGLRIVADLAVDWGSYDVPHEGKVVWFEIA